MIERAPAEAQSTEYDVAIIGGGILGVTLLLESSLRGYRAVLLERDDFGSGSTLNSLRILHGGLRYLQTADLGRFFESIGERRWYGRHYPQMIEPLMCVMALSGRGVQRRWIMQSALTLNDLLAIRRNAGLRSDQRLGSSRTISGDTLAQLIPGFHINNSYAGAVWFDARMAQPVRIVMELLRHACSAGAIALNYVEAIKLTSRNGAVRGVHAIDRLSGRELLFSAGTVINATGPWAAATARKLGATNIPDLPLTLAWNVQVKRAPISKAALVVTPHNMRTGRSYVIVPAKTHMLIGTGQTQFGEPIKNANPTDDQMREFIEDVNNALPGLSINSDDIGCIYTGLAPACMKGQASFANRPWVVDHRNYDGPTGLLSAAAVKFTTARRTSLELIRTFGYSATDTKGEQLILADKCREQRLSLARSAQDRDCPISGQMVAQWLILAADESAMMPEDLIIRRLGVTDDADRAEELIELVKSDGRFEAYQNEL